MKKEIFFRRMSTAMTEYTPSLWHRMNENFKFSLKTENFVFFLLNTCVREKRITLWFFLSSYLGLIFRNVYFIYPRSFFPSLTYKNIFLGKQTWRGRGRKMIFWNKKKTEKLSKFNLPSVWATIFHFRTHRKIYYFSLPP